MTRVKGIGFLLKSRFDRFVNCPNSVGSDKIRLSSLKRVSINHHESVGVFICRKCEENN